MKRALVILITTTLIFTWPAAPHAQGTRQVKVLVEFRQSGDQSQQELGGSGEVVITKRGSARPSGRIQAEDRQTRVEHSTGIFTIVQDAGEAILSVATKVPYLEVAFYRDYATHAGYLASRVAFHEVGTSLKVRATILPGNQVRVRLTPRVSYFSADGSGAIDFTEASTELVVPSGQAVILGGATTEMHQVTRRILGFGARQTGSETAVTLTATIQ